MCIAKQVKHSLIATTFNQEVSILMKIKHLGSKEFPQSQIDAPRDFILKVIELTCGGGLFHKEGVKKNITLEI